MLKKMLLAAVLSVFMIGCLMSSSIAAGNPYPDTSQYNQSKLNVADLNDISKYKTIGAVRMSQMIISYHISVGDVFPKYVSLLWYGQTVTGFTYYDSGVFHIWMKQSPHDPLFKKFPIIKHIQESFKTDFEHVWKNVKFPLALTL